ncbi:hypothetical protein [uncultured Thiothrix sp.]|uniref:hypothetical protein n=1 Tax=uncultured Thiothrix sp. TaxID=223185 RepID=UPI00260D98A7|nr:hypothetical protein [uncultured Thiothrix sp.]HMT93267.1 hypothetical protein [Thiolinea sp.]
MIPAIRVAACLITVWLLHGCGGGSDNTNNGGDGGVTPPAGTGKLVVSHPQNSSTIALVNIPYTTTPSTAAARQAGNTSATGEYKYDTSEQVSFSLFNTTFAGITTKASINEDDLAVSFCKNHAAPASCQYKVARNVQRLLLSTDTDQNYTNGITILANFQQNPPLALDSEIDQFELALAKKLSPLGRQTVALFSPSLGINLESPQPESDEVGGQPVAFVDLFRISRPFPEFSCTDIKYDSHGWPTEIPASCDTQVNPTFRTPTWATTLILRYLPYGAIPTGKYTVLYEGAGSLQYSGIANKLPAESQPGRDVIEITPDLIKTRNSAGLRVQLKDMDSANPVKNIRIVMPGGTCEGNPLVRVDSEADCPSGQYRSFVDTLAADRNSIIFNPDYLRFLKDFKVLRTMNLMEMSPRNRACYPLTDDAYKQCLLQEFTWDQRAKMDQASWGGSSRTPLLKLYARGAPLEVVVALANTLNKDVWFNLPHNATNDYVTQFATYVRDTLNPNLKIHVEYTNEPWNAIFWGAMYVRMKGIALGLDTTEWRAGYKYYSNRSVEIFKIWHDIFGGSERLIRTLNTYHPDEWMSRNMLSYNGNSQFVDALASAPYFQGCWDKSANVACADTTKNPLVVKDATSVDDLFTIIDNPNNPYGIAATLKWMSVQAKVAKDFNVDFYTYEGGQHLVTKNEDQTLTADHRKRLLDLIRAANRDPRMAGRYSQMLTGWKESGGKLFMLFTMPQSYHSWGTFGIKEHLNQARSEAPKYDMSMQFQEMQKKCWWADCE